MQPRPLRNFPIRNPFYGQAEHANKPLPFNRLLSRIPVDQDFIEKIDGDLKVFLKMSRCASN